MGPERFPRTPWWGIVIILAISLLLGVFVGLNWMSVVLIVALALAVGFLMSGPNEREG